MHAETYIIGERQSKEKISFQPDQTFQKFAITLIGIVKKLIRN